MTKEELIDKFHEKIRNYIPCFYYEDFSYHVLVVADGIVLVAEDTVFRAAILVESTEISAIYARLLSEFLSKISTKDDAIMLTFMLMFATGCYNDFCVVRIDGYNNDNYAIN